MPSDATERISTQFAPECARYLLLNFHHSDIPLCQVVVKWYGLDRLPYGGYDLDFLIDHLLVDHSNRVGSWVY